MAYSLKKLSTSYDQKYGGEPYHNHLEAVVTRLKGIGITDEDVLCAAWLYDTIEDTDTAFAH